MNPDLLPQIGKYIFTAIGVALTVGSFFLYKNTQAFLDKSIPAQGKVVDLKLVDETYRPVVEFQDKQGQSIQFESSYASSPPAFDVGEEVRVLYDPQDPQKAQINTFVSLWLGLLITGPLAVIFLAVGVGSIFFARA